MIYKRVIAATRCVAIAALSLAMTFPVSAGPVGWAWSPDKNAVPSAMCQDAAGNTYVVGQFWGTVIFDGGYTFTDSSSTSDMFLVKLSRDNRVIWARQFGGAATEAPRAIAVDSKGQIYVVGTFSSGTANLGGADLLKTGVQFDSFLAKYDPQGNHLWSQRLGTLRLDVGFQPANVSYSLALDHGEQNIYVGGYYKGHLEFSADSVFDSVSGDSDSLFSKYSAATGAFLWAQTFRDNIGSDLIQRVLVDGDDNLIVAGQFTSIINLGFGELFSPGADAGSRQDIYVAKFGPTGSTPPTLPVWGKQYGGSHLDWITNAALTSRGDIVVAGTYNTQTSFGGSVFTAMGVVNDSYVAQISGQTGNHMWSRSIGGPNNATTVRGVALDSFDNVYLVGRFDGSAYLNGNGDSQLFVSAGSDDGFVSEFSAAGNSLGSRQFGGTQGDDVTAVAVGPSDHLVLSVNFGATINLGGAVLSAPATSNRSAVLSYAP